MEKPSFSCRSKPSCLELPFTAWISSIVHLNQDFSDGIAILNDSLTTLLYNDHEAINKITGGRLLLRRKLEFLIGK